MKLIKKFLSLWLCLALSSNFCCALKGTESTHVIETSTLAKSDPALIAIWSKIEAFSNAPAGAVSGVTIDEINLLCNRVKPLLLAEPTLLEVPPPTTVFGDIHGNFSALWTFYQDCPRSEGQEAPMLFLGDYVDRGLNSIETMVMLMILKIRSPQNVFLLRGNHECTDQNGIIDEPEPSLLKECRNIFGDLGIQVWSTFNEVFGCLPLAAILDEVIFCVHGGISPFLLNFDKIREIQRPFPLCINKLNTRQQKLAIDLLWGDPTICTGRYCTSKRGPSLLGFGIGAMNDFFTTCGVDIIFRAHEACQYGYQFPFSSCSRSSISHCCITVFSTCNYCERKNWASVIRVEEDLDFSFITMSPEGQIAPLPTAVT